VFKQRKLFRLMVILIVVLALVVIAVFTLVIPWLTGTQVPVAEAPQPTTTPAESPTAPPAEVEPSPPPENIMVFSEEELQGALDRLSDMVNQSDAAKVEYIRVKLEQDRMLLSAEGEARDYKLKTEDLEVRFEEKTVFVSGEVSALGLSLPLTAEAEINCESGKPSVEVSEFNLSGLPLAALGLSEDKISELINDAIEAADIEVPVDLEGIRIEDGKLIVVYK